MTRAQVNPGVDQGAVAPPDRAAVGFHRRLAGYRATPVHDLPDVARQLGLGAVGVKDETDRFGLPAFKILGASWAVEQALRRDPGVHTLVAASAGNHGRAVAHVAAQRNLRARVFLPERSARPRRDAIASEGADVVVVDGTYEDAVALAARAASQPGVAEIADVGDADAARWVIDGYATLFAELDGHWDVIVVPTGVGSLAAAAARHAATAGARALAVEPATAGCLAASLAAGRPVAVPTPGTRMAGLDCAEVSPAAWPTLRDGVHGSVLVPDHEAATARSELHAGGIPVGDCGAAALAALRATMGDPACEPLRRALALDGASRVLLLATEGVTNPAA